MGNSNWFLKELARRNVLRAAVLYVGAVWVLAQGIAQLSPALGLPEMTARWFIVAAAIGFPFWIGFAWFYQLTPDGFRRDHRVDPEDSIAGRTGRTLNLAIIGVLALAVVLLLTDRLLGARGLARLPEKSVAVLPFENLSDDKDGEYFVVGMQDQILTRLAGMGDLRVVSRTSTEKYRSHAEDLREVGRALGVATVLEGSVQRVGDRVRIAVQLIDADSDSHLWAQSYDRDMQDVFAVQSDVAGKIASALQVTLQPAEQAALDREPTDDPLAYDLFLRAEYLAERGRLNQDAGLLRQSLEPFRQAIARDPRFALAIARLSLAQTSLVWLDAEGIDANAMSARARENAERARRLDPDLADAFIALGFNDVFGRGRQDLGAALASFAIAQRLRPSEARAMSAAAYVYRMQGRSDDAIRKLEEALEHDPRNPAILNSLAATYMAVRRYRDAEAVLRRALAVEPGNHLARTILGSAVLRRTGDPASALAVLQGDHPYLRLARSSNLFFQRKYPEALAELKSVPDSPDLFENSGGPSRTAAIAVLYRHMGEPELARRYFEQAEGPARRTLAEAEARGSDVLLLGARQSVAEIEAGLGHTGEAMRLIAETQAMAEALDDELAMLSFSRSTAALYSALGQAGPAVTLIDRVLGAPNGGLAYSAPLLGIDPAWDPIRNDPGFIALTEKYPVDGPATTAVMVRGMDDPPWGEAVQ